jgi:hypothetical protein
VRFYKAKIVLVTSFILVGQLNIPASASTLQLVVAEDKTTGYNRNLFKHWIDADKDGCNTRAEVLIEEAVVKPKIGPKCKLTGGEWVSAYDGKKVTNASQLDVDHLVPLAEAWRSGAWKWTAAQRQAYANDLDNSEALIAVTLKTNRSKSDKDPASWMPELNKCGYINDWIKLKGKYDLSVDKNEERILRMQISSCKIEDVQLGDIPRLSPPVVTILESTNPDFMDVSIFIPKYEGQDGQRINNPDNAETFIWIEYAVLKRDAVGSGIDGNRCKGVYNQGLLIKTTPANLNCQIIKGIELEIYYYINNCGKCQPAPADYWAQRSPGVIVSTGDLASPSPTPTPNIPIAELIVTPGAFCSPAGAIGKASSGVTYTCKTSPTDSRNRWRQ